MNEDQKESALNFPLDFKGKRGCETRKEFCFSYETEPEGASEALFLGAWYLFIQNYTGEENPVIAVKGRGICFSPSQNLTAVEFLKEVSHLSEKSSSEEGWQTAFLFNDEEESSALPPLSFSAVEMEGGYALSLIYNSSCFRESTIIKMSENLLHLMNELRMDEKPLQDIKPFSEAEKNRLIYRLNPEEILKEGPCTIHEGLEKQALLTPDATALWYKGEAVTYRELNERANRGAHKLINRGLKPGTIVGLWQEMSPSLIISLFSVLKAGCAYVPIDSKTPAERVSGILSDSNAGVLIGDRDLPGSSCETIDISELFTGGSENPSLNMDGTELAYVIYTSGSTGKPKGVMIEHRSVMNLTSWFAREMDFTSHPRMLQMTKICFDVSVDEILSTLLGGASVYIPHGDMRLNKKELTEFINTHEITMAEFVPSLLQDYIVDNEFMPSLKVIITGAERLQPALRDRVLDKGYTLYNLYGPTETTVTSVFMKCDRERDVIGRPVDNTRVYICTPGGELTPAGVPGELVIGGAGLARGYLGDPELTEKKFIPCPFLPGERLYKTGDLARWLPDGTLEFLGRIDNQVKIRGYRVEPGETEARMLEHPAVKEACVVVVPDNLGNNTLRGFWVSEKNLSPEELKGFLLETLPDYMVPSPLIPMDSLPVTKNGKYDRQALKEFSVSEKKPEITLPENETEEKLKEILSVILGKEELCTQSPFEELGANSIHVIKMVTEINKKFQIRLPVVKVLKNKNIQALSRSIQEYIKE